MYRVYETEGIILKSSPKGETGASYVVLTRNMGLIRATAQGMRTPKSKLRPFLVEYKPVYICLVKGKELWRVTNARELSVLPRLGSLKLVAFARVLSLVSNMVHGEEKDEVLFDTVHALYKELSVSSEVSTRNIEEISVLRILSILGYVKTSPTLSPFVNTVSSFGDLVPLFEPVRREAILAINTALKASQL